MKFTTHNQAKIETSGMYLQGYIRCSYDDLVDAFGVSSNWDNYKSDAEWQICFEDGTRATIYNYKDGKNYCGKYGLEVQEIKEWHIGGFNQDAVDRVSKALHATNLTGFFA